MTSSLDEAGPLTSLSAATAHYSFDLNEINLGVPSGVRLGREPNEGYRRGWGLQFGDLSSRIEEEYLFRAALDTVEIPSLLVEAKRKNLYLLMTRYLPRLTARNIVEFGAYRGGNALFMALVMREIDPSAKIYALDTYEGMPQTDKSRDAHSEGDFADANYDRLIEVRDYLGLNNLIPVKGLFENTFPQLAGPFGLAHIDCDIYSAVKYSQEAVWPRMTPGGYVAYDDAEVSSCLGATEAVEELIQSGHRCEQIWPHFVFRANLA